MCETLLKDKRKCVVLI